MTTRKIPCDKKTVIISEKELPLCCPLPSQTLWNGHPRVYLEIEKTWHVVCPYCETKYILK
ncbi:MAG: hypothetical protein ACD_42C00573G0001 [uncultured bacterium]|nr:MAG: hypothetical protein ACD_42C00573G0001 [uncultured bacterium]OGT26567.1 MAG: hypothetical protein A3B71_02785 [Gammaproteobacteria bacterium RIFCSPHIGHO2_02_FULL_42_43]OGT51994.1 MAG: hypothetical protein A3E54_04290 [Gammaproteobacteria bacterium RIFCSPHIGHO2_12_FULL_41_25]OGT61099.1 MAG: hypothetical protein A3I77_06950 [Gammaproteobacteria bacterium RIFCSPLOWO2_02_FULL_42_14]OGT87027.1 MAG: hypothetical protein A3G86_00670 [Gammaproteobacteria bacterium RIFCSPLOWO2_12_FULL_42_18]